MMMMIMIGVLLNLNLDFKVMDNIEKKETEQIFDSKYKRILPSEEELIAELAREKR